MPRNSTAFKHFAAVSPCRCRRPSLKNPVNGLTSLNKEVGGVRAFGVFPLFLPLAITAFGGPEGYFSFVIIAFGAFQFIVPKYYDRLGRMDFEGSSLLILI